MQKFENVHIFMKCTLQCIYNMLQYQIYSPVLLNKTAQQNLKIVQRSAQLVAQ